MRLLNTSTFQFETIPEQKLDASEEKYAVLSHRWGASEDEVLYADVMSGAFSHKNGFAKLKGFCDKARQLGCTYCWADTCCINKKDPSEMSKAINSMYRWYQRSHIGIVYLADVPTKHMLDSEWFDRGWTLQELIGPKAASFYDCNWNLIGTKSDLLAHLHSKTGIRKDVLSHDTKPSTCSIAQRMSWAASRVTTETEDVAYSLLGIFGVSMPLLYGEGEKAFLRLQRAIIDQSKDESIFAWAMDSKNSEDRSIFRGLLAPSPASYIKCGDVISTRGSEGFSEENGRISINLWTFPYSMETYHAILNCTFRASPEDRIAITVTGLETENEYVRVNRTLDGTTTFSLSDLQRFKNRPVGAKRRLIRVPSDPNDPPLNRTYGFWLRTIKPPGHNDCVTKILSRTHQPMKSFVCSEDDTRGTVGIVSLKPRSPPAAKYSTFDQVGWSKVRWIRLGFDDDFNPVLSLENSAQETMSMPHRYSKNEETFEQAFESEVGAEAHSTIFSNYWIDGLHPSLRKQPSVPNRKLGWPTGIATLKVDRTKGVHGCLEALNLGISVELVPDISPDLTSAKSNHRNPKQVWVVDITDIEGSDPEQALAIIAKEESWYECLRCCLGCEAPGYEAETARKNEIRGVRRVLSASNLAKLD